MENNNRQENKGISIDREAQINLVVNRPESDEVTIDLGRVFHNFKQRTPIFIWLLLLCLVAGLCVPLVMYQINKPMLTVSSVVTLSYDVKSTSYVNGRKVTTYTPVVDLTAPDGSELDLTQISSSYVLQNAIRAAKLSRDISLSGLRGNLKVERVLTEESRRAQEMAAKMTEDKNNEAYKQAQAVTMVYDKKFVVSLTNGFKEGDAENSPKVELENDELRQLLDQILAAYNDYLVKTYADVKLPDDELAVIDTEHLDLLESLRRLRTANTNLYTYCDEQPETIRLYRSSSTGKSLESWKNILQTIREVRIDYLYSYLYTNSIVKDRTSMITSYEYDLRNAQTELDTVNDRIATVKEILENYKNDEIYVSMQESDTAKSTKTTTDYYNELVLQQAANYDQVAELEVRIADLKDTLNAVQSAENIGMSTEEAELELQKTMDSATAAYNGIRSHMEELYESPFYTTYVEHTAAQGKQDNFIVANLKKMIIFGVVGAVIALALWFLSALAPEFNMHRHEEDEKRKEAIRK